MLSTVLGTAWVQTDDARGLATSQGLYETSRSADLHMQASSQ